MPSVVGSSFGVEDVSFFRTYFGDLLAFGFFPWPGLGVLGLDVEVSNALSEEAPVPSADVSVLFSLNTSAS